MRHLGILVFAAVFLAAISLPLSGQQGGGRTGGGGGSRGGGQPSASGPGATTSPGGLGQSRTGERNEMSDWNYTAGVGE